MYEIVSFLGKGAFGMVFIKLLYKVFKYVNRLNG